MVALYPEIKLGEDEEIYTECIFLIDRSGSMAGSRINQVPFPFPSPFLLCNDKY